jgi:hypothetical protein
MGQITFWVSANDVKLLSENINIIRGDACYHSIQNLVFPSSVQKHKD